MARNSSVSSPDTLAQAIGRVSMSWSALEMGMTFMLKEVLNTDIITALAVSYSMEYSRRRDLMNSLAALKLSKHRKQYISLMTEVNGASKERNAIIHGSFGDDIRINCMNRGKLTFKTTKEQPNRISSVATKIANLANRMAPFTACIQSDVEAWTKKHVPALPPLPQEFLQNHPAKIRDTP